MLLPCVPWETIRCLHASLTRVLFERYWDISLYLRFIEKSNSINRWKLIDFSKDTMKKNVFNIYCSMFCYQRLKKAFHILLFYSANNSWKRSLRKDRKIVDCRIMRTKGEFGAGQFRETVTNLQEHSIGCFIIFKIREFSKLFCLFKVSSLKYQVA